MFFNGASLGIPATLLDRPRVREELAKTKRTPRSFVCLFFVGFVFSLGICFGLLVFVCFDF